MVVHGVDWPGRLVEDGSGWYRVGAQMLARVHWPSPEELLTVGQEGLYSVLAS